MKAMQNAEYKNPMKESALLWCQITGKLTSRKTTKSCKIPHREMQGVIDHYCSIKSLHSVEINRGTFCNETMLNLRCCMGKYNGGKQVTTM